MAAGGWRRVRVYPSKWVQGGCLSDGCNNFRGDGVEFHVPAAGGGFEDGHGRVVAAPVLNHRSRRCAGVHVPAAKIQNPEVHLAELVLLGPKHNSGP